MLRILVTPRKSYASLGWIGSIWRGMVSPKSRRCCKVKGKVTSVASLTVLRRGVELKDWMLDQIKSCLTMRFLWRELLKRLKVWSRHPRSSHSRSSHLKKHCTYTFCLYFNDFLALRMFKSGKTFWLYYANIDIYSKRIDIGVLIA